MSCVDSCRCFKYVFDIRVFKSCDCPTGGLTSVSVVIMHASAVSLRAVVFISLVRSRIAKSIRAFGFLLRRLPLPLARDNI
jgi:hypothetical protein